ncbi:MAG: hypothetical protein MJ119_01250 [Lachnospiraceae bacterium]|nr:hypothetical protein [Lachnospiraceae bacterium]
MKELFKPLIKKYSRKFLLKVLGIIAVPLALIFIHYLSKALFNLCVKRMKKKLVSLIPFVNN